MATSKNRITKSIDAPLSGIRFCSVCGADISHKRPGSKTCSSACRKALERQIKRDKSQMSHIDKTPAVEPAPLPSEAFQQFRQMFELFAKDFQSYMAVEMPQQINSAVQQAIGGLQLQVATLTNVQVAPVHQPPMRQLSPLPEPEITQTKIKSDGSAAENFLRCVGAVTGAQLTAPKPERVIPIKQNGREVGIKRMDVPQFAPPSFDDDEIEIG